ncbi:AcfA family outer membrane beta-barrel protein [Aliivibrio sp. S4TY2]|uniref:AcfA family outer membrane beta-barrel protein n=1 Tax=unclassified Aliivibrio TaxID=2645654 RepID=UPI00237913C0|nr:MULTISPECIES: AcfA family outer membrane beta-barrel protein [unclassified Aliivibrio]MDD9154906.1 AcfA family outer membrane beta-barrel protein [Aliivibrio sp. S4TY2]MDD9158731.1 AcfA family outer membrane beta-barrel protein [Aliivibrio sp. S4TY1]MDD9162909.1 AcfA family outer membrane beta-barrel protein [Aliivibrio sp. S4MY2]MDD9166730.1 AcfA family outer membrane beta-barrel protein [Aliivibrio sp. S4MY4]MDD9183986.1 AcfA family outer membrane beta-barrel protein [Aliivibrio sp. S4MY3
MKKYVFLLMTATSTATVAAPYVGLEYGVTNMSHDYSTTFSQDKVTLTPDDSSSAFGGFVGYRFNDFGLELGYKKFESDGSRSQMLVSDKAGYTKEREWDADLDATQFTFKPVYFYHINEKLQLKTGLGLTITKYNFDSSAYTEYENDLTDHEYVEKGSYTPGASKSETALGGIASVGIEYMVIPNLALGASASYQADSVANSTSFMLSSAYYF